MAEDTGYSMEGVDYKGTPVTLYAGGGKLRTEAEFATALKQYNDSEGKVKPSGFSILEPGSAAMIRRGFETLNQPFQAAVSAQLDDPNARINSMPEPLQTAAKYILRAPAEAVKTPERAGVTAGMTAAIPLLPALAAPGAVIGLGAIAKHVLGSMLVTGAGGAIGGAAGQAMTGDTPTWGNTVVNFTQAAGAGGFQSVMSQFMNRFLRPDKAEEVAGQVMDSLKAKYPTLSGDPNALNIVGKNKADIAAITQKGAEALLGTVDEATSNLVKRVNAELPRNLTVGQQATMRMHVRNLAEANKSYVSALGDSDAMQTAHEALANAQDKLIEFIGDSFKGTNIKNITSTLGRVAGVLQQDFAALSKYEQGMAVLHAMKQAGQDTGFDPVAFAQAIQGTYHAQGPLLQQVGGILGQGQPLTGMNLTQRTAQYGEGATGAILGWLRDQIPFVRYAKALGGANKAPVLPWQQPSVGALQALGWQTEGQKAMRDFMGTGRKEQ